MGTTTFLGDLPQRSSPYLSTQPLLRVTLYTKRCSSKGAPTLHRSGFATGHGGASQRAAATSSQGPAMYSTKHKLPCQVSAGTLTNSLLLSHGSRSQDDTRPAPSHPWTPEEGLQAALVFFPSDYLKLWLCNSTGTGSLFKSDARLARADLLTTLKPLLC